MARVLHRDNPAAEPLVGNVKVTRQDWLNAALDILIRDGVDQVKVTALADLLEVSRSSFYWYFKSRNDLLDALLAHWEATNTAAMLGQAAARAETITAAVCNVFRCTANPALFNTALDFAVRDWARRSDDVRSMIDRSDARRVAALTEMFARYGYPSPEARTRARVLYFMQIGYDLAGVPEDPGQRLDQVPDYLRVFTGQEPLAAEIEAFNAYARAYWGLSSSDATDQERPAGSKKSPDLL